MEHPKEDEEVVKAYLEERVIPKLKEMGLTGHVFVKNGRFSNKFNANGTCNLYGLHELYRAIIPACVSWPRPTETIKLLSDRAKSAIRCGLRTWIP